MPSIKIVLRKKPNQQGQLPICLRITVDRKSTYVYLGQYLEKKHWDAINTKVKKSHPNSMLLNHFISHKFSEANATLLELTHRDRVLTIDEVKQAFNPSASRTSVFERCELFFQELKVARKFNRYTGEMSAYRNLRHYRKNVDLSFEELTVDLLRDFKGYLIGKRGVSESTTVNYFLTLRTIYNRAISDGIVDASHYPFGKGKITLKRKESLKIGLTKEEVKKLEQAELDEKSFAHHARNLWLVSFYFAGLRVGDLLRLKWKDFHDGRLYYTMSKNKKSASIKVSPKAQAILDQYRQMNLSHDLVFPELSKLDSIADRFQVEKTMSYRARKINKALQTLAKELEIDKPLTAHIARHTFATIAGDKIPIQRLQQLYRHSSITTTIGYQKAFMNRTTDEALDSVLDF